MTSRLSFFTSGPFRVNVGDRPLEGLSGGKASALLVYLATQPGRKHRREVLAELLWPDLDAEQARANLRHSVFHLRRALEIDAQAQPVLLSGREWLGFNPDCNYWIDAIALTSPAPSCAVAKPTLKSCASCLAQMEHMAGLYRGEFMAGLVLPDCPDFESWLQIQREALHRHALSLLEKLSDCYEQMGDYAKALPFAARYAELEPLDETAQRRAMRLYALNGQRSAALLQYESCCRSIKDELGALPDEQTRQLAERIRGGGVKRNASDTPLTPSFPRRRESSENNIPQRGQSNPGFEEQQNPIDPLRGNYSTDWIPACAGMTQAPAERRQVTVLYCELHVATDDPNEAMEQLVAPQARCVAAIRQYNGHIVQTHGGGLLCYFGYPQAEENAARHAVQAALAVTSVATQHIEIRAGVHTGFVITGGDMPDTTGKTSRLAILLRLCAAPNEATVSQETHQLVAGYFACENLGRQALPGIAQPVEIFRVIRESGARTRLDAATQLTPFAGRKAELAQLLKLWKSALQGRQHVVLVQGEAGIGKSRLLRALKEKLRDAQYVVRELHCFPEFSQSPFHPLIAMLEMLLGFAQDDTPEIKSGKLAHYLEAHYPAAAREAVPLIAQLLALPLAGPYPALALAPQMQKERTIAILLDIVQALAARHPLLLILEDLHWVDPSTLELLSAFVAQQRKGTVLALLTARPEFPAPWQPNLYRMLKLAPLDKDAAAEMIRSLNENIPPGTVRQIAERSDGVPLFVEEMAKMTALGKQADIPATLLDLLAARMDNMGEAKHTAQLAAAIGREFDLALLRKISPSAPHSLADNLNALRNAGLILEAGEATLQFKHALIQEAAYQSMTKSARQDAHLRVAQTLQNDYHDVVATQPELLAQHLAAAGETRQAIAYWIKAGQRAALNSATTEAIGHFNSGLQLLMALPPSHERDHVESALQLNIGTALIATKGYGSTEGGEAYARALELCEKSGDNSGVYRALWGMWLTSSSRVGHAHSLALAGKLLRLAEQTRDVLQLQSAHHAMGNSSLMTGNPHAARLHLEQSMSLYQPSHHGAMVSQYGENICVSSASLLSWALWLQGFPAQANAASQQAILQARQLEHPYSLGYALCAAAMLHGWLKDIETTGQLAQEAVALSQKHGLPFWLGMGASSCGWAMAMQGQAAGVAQIRQCLDAVNAVMSGALILFLAPLCEALVELGQYDDALEALNVALGVAEEKNDRLFESEFQHLKGVCLLKISAANETEAEACLAQALSLSRKQGAKSLELRAATSLARLWQQQGKIKKARPLLEKIIGQFTEGFATADLQEAKTLLQKLA